MTTTDAPVTEVSSIVAGRRVPGEATAVESTNPSHTADTVARVSLAGPQTLVDAAARSSRSAASSRTTRRRSPAW